MDPKDVTVAVSELKLNDKPATTPATAAVAAPVKSAPKAAKVKNEEFILKTPKVFEHFCPKN